MMSFKLTEGQNQVREFLRWLAREKVRPIAEESDRNHGYSDEFLTELMHMGISGGTALPGEEPVGGDADKPKKGPRQSNRISLIAVEEMSWGDGSVILNLPGPGLGGPPVKFMGTPEQQERFLAPFKLKDKPRFGAYGLTEPGAGSDVSAISATCRKDGNHWVLNGRKCFITNGAKADWVVIFATVDRGLGRAGHRAFVVEKGTPGFSVGKIEKKMGLRASETAELVLEDCRVHQDNLLGGEKHYEGKEGFMGAMKTFDSTRPIVAAMAVGIGRGALELATDYVRENYMLSRPIPRYQQIKDVLARTARKLDAARLLCWRAAWMADEELPNAKEASMAKVFAAQAAQQATIDALQVVGSTGLERSTLLEKFFRDIKVYDIFEGTGQVQRIVIAKRIMDTLKSF
ncbi:MAG: acyl-CoA dehydrogenase family protein [Myxococcota bacterium]